MPKHECFQLRCSAPRSEAGSDEGEVMLYGEIVQDYGKWYKENYPEDKSASDFDKAIKQIKKDGAKRLLLRINSPGGIVTQAIAMRTILTTAAFEQVTVRIEGLCASAATFLASFPGAKVQIGEGAEYMIHNPWGGCFGGAEDMENYAKRLRNIEKTSRDFYAAKTGQSEDQIKKWMDAETWFTAKEAKEYGFADEILTASETDEMPMVASVSSETLAAMKSLYQAVPEQITVIEKEKTDCHTSAAALVRNDKDGGKEEADCRTSAAAPVRNDKEEGTIPPAHNADSLCTGEAETVTNGTPVAGAPSENTSKEEEMQTMEPKELTAEEIKAQNPALYDQMRESAIQEERKRVEDIDALTLPGYESMAAEAKKNGTSAMEFQKQVVAAQKQKGSDFLRERKEETKEAQKVPGGAAPGAKDEQQEIEAFAKDIAAYANGYHGSNDASMY